MTDADLAFERLLADGLAPADRPPDAAFVARVDRAVIADALFRRQREALWRRFGGETLAIAAVGAGLAVLARIPDLREALAGTSDLALPAMLALPLLLLWILVTKARPLSA
jgi:hypothetical protein